MHNADIFVRPWNTHRGDIMQDSIWAGMNLPEFPKMERNLSADVVIVGGGLAGLLCAWELKEAGIDCVLIEADRICHGVTRNTTAKVTSQHGLIYDKLIREFGTDTAKMYYEVNQAALERYRKLARQFPCDFENRDNYIYSTRSKAALVREMRALEAIGAAADYVESADLPFPAAGAIRFRNQAQFHPLKFAAGIARELNIYEHTPAREFGKGWVRTDGGIIKADAVIIATHFPIINKHGGYFLKMYQQRSYVLALENAGKVEGMYLDNAENGLSLRMQGDLLLFGGGGHRTGKQGGGWAYLEEQARKYFPEGRIIRRWATQDCMTLDGIPYIGRYSRGTENLYVATGFNKWGMTSSMVSAMLLAALIQGKASPWASVFAPDRTVLRPQLALNAIESTVNLLTPTAPRCPHLGCALKWNAQEHSWDCPCHGSRFTEDGRLLDNPATGDLKKRRSD